jgi:aminoglycoside phosphotransferase family enzyme/predicted kinase
MDLRDDLARPDAYAPAQPSGATVIETHISWVFLVEREVFKVKKPVALGFLDFRTVEERRRACLAEVELNARLAPGVYLGVVPVRVSGGRATFHGEGPIVDYAVHMRRLGDEARADVRLERGRLSGRDIDAVAGRLAAFHASAHTGPEIARFGAPDAVEYNIQENFRQTAGSLLTFLGDEEAAEIVRWQTAFVRDRASVFESRVAAGRVRDGHGDLRLEHVYLLGDGPPIAIDCIEFNDRFRYADVCADLAFLSMDLAAHARVDLGERLLASYARESGDYDLYALVDFYEAYRAFVRGKIAALVASDPAVDEGRRERAGREARKAFLLALSAGRSSLVQPAVVAVGGVIASGKSTIADEVGLALSAPVIDADRTRKQLLGVTPTHRLENASWTGGYDPGVTAKVYDEVLRRAEVVLASGRPVVLDASFRAAEHRAAARALAARLGLPFAFVECTADLPTYEARLAARARQPGVSDGRVEILHDFMAHFEPVTEMSASEHVRIDTRRPLDESLATLRTRLGSWPAGLV